MILIKRDLKDLVLPPYHGKGHLLLDKVAQILSLLMFFNGSFFSSTFFFLNHAQLVTCSLLAYSLSGTGIPILYWRVTIYIVQCEDRCTCLGLLNVPLI